MKCFDVPDLVEKSKIIQKRTKRIMAKIKKISLKPSSALDGAKKLGSAKIKPILIRRNGLTLKLCETF